MSFGQNGSDKINQGVPILIKLLSGTDAKSISSEMGVTTARIYEIAKDTAYRVLPLVVGAAGHPLCQLPQLSLNITTIKQDGGLCKQMFDYLVDMVDPYENLVPSACFPAMVKLGVYNKADFIRLCSVADTDHARQQMLHVVSRREAMAVQRCIESYIKSKMNASTDAMDDFKKAIQGVKHTLSLEDAISFVTAIYQD